MGWSYLQKGSRSLYLLVLVFDFGLFISFISLVRGGGWGGGGGYVAVLPDASLGCFFTLIFEIDLCFIIIASRRLSGLTTVMCIES